MTEPPEHRACRTQTTPERRGVESVLRQWRPGDSNAHNVYIGNEHVGVFFNPDLTDEVVQRMNDGPERDERLRAEGRREADDAINWNTSCIGCAGRLDSLYAERSAGAEGTARFIAAEIRGLYSVLGDRALLEAVAIAERHALGGPVSTESAQGARNAVADTPGRQGASRGAKPFDDPA